MPKKKFSIVVKRRIVLSVIGLIFICLAAWLKNYFSHKEEKPKSTVSTNNNKVIINASKDSSSLNNVQNEQTTIGRDQNNAGRDLTISNKNYIDKKSVKTDNRKVTVNGPAFFDSSKQINNYNAPEHRHLTLEDEQLIKNFLPLSYPIWFYYCNANPECQYFSQEAHTQLEQWGYKFSGSGLYIGDAKIPGQPWYLEKDTVNKRASFYIYSKY